MLSTKRFRRTAVPFAAAVIALGGLLSACGGSDPAPRAVATSAPAPTSAAAPAPELAGQASVPAKTQGWLKIYAGTAPAGSKAVQLAVTSNPAVGQYVSDGAGLSLYRFDKDSANPSVSNCAGQCAVTWPPLTVTREQSLFVTGVDPQRVGFIERADGACQITIAGWPVYYFNKDQKAGDLLGQGVGGTWFAVAPTGAKATAH
jgi:predicted lipoprotein with Yx(FWY)xxD motif